MLLQSERINAYAQTVIRTLQADEHQRGCLMEERVLKGNLAYESSMPRLAVVSHSEGGKARRGGRDWRFTI